jgi:glutathione S-transferase
VALTLHEHPFAAYCWKALIALYELDLPFERHRIEGEDDRRALATLWPMAGIPVLVDDDAKLTLPESTTIVEYLDRLAGAGRLVPADAAEALRARLWDRIFDQHVATPMQTIVGDSLRPQGAGDPHGVEQARTGLDTAYAMLDAWLPESGWAAGPSFTMAECAAAPALHYGYVVHRWDEDRLPNLHGYYERVTAHPTVARVIDEARPWRGVFPLGWPDHVN